MRENFHLFERVGKIGSFLVGAATVGALFFAYDQYVTTHGPEYQAKSKMNRVLKAINGNNYCAVYGNGTVERTQFTQSPTGTWSMKFWQIIAPVHNSPIKGWTSNLSDLTPDKSKEFSATYIIEKKHYREGVYLIDQDGIFTYKPCSNTDRCGGVQSYPCSNMNYPGVDRITKSDPIEDE